MPITEFRAQDIAQPQITANTVPVGYTLELHISTRNGIFAGELMNISVLVHGVNITNLLSYYCCIGFLYAYTNTGFDLSPLGDIASYPLNEVITVSSKGSDRGIGYATSGQIQYEDGVTAYAFLVPSLPFKNWTVTLSQIQQIPSIMVVGGQAEYIASESNVIFLGLTFILVAFGVLALQPILDTIFPEKGIEYTTQSKKKKSSENRKEIWLFGKIPEKTPIIESVETQSASEDDKPAESQVKK